MEHRETTFEEMLKLSGRIVYKNKGDSMWPLIREGKDLVVILPKPQGRLRRYDIPLYQRDTDKSGKTGKYILHRILKVRTEDYLISGDNRWNIEKGISDRHIIGVLGAVIRGGASGNREHIITTEDRIYRIYTHLWCDLFPIRASIFWLRDLPRRACRFIKRKRA